MDAKKPLDYLTELLDGKPEAGSVEMFVDVAELHAARALLDAATAPQRAIEALLHLAYAAWCLADDSEDLGDGYHKVDHDNFKNLCDQLDALDELPQDQPGYIMGPAAKARWALRHLIGEDASNKPTEA